MTERQRVIDLSVPKRVHRPIEELLIVSPQECWRAWVHKIANDPSVDLRSIMDHVQLHVGQHMPNSDATLERWEDWLGGTYNLLAILGCLVGTDPAHLVGLDLLFRKWVTDPANHTQPPAAVIPEPAAPVLCRYTVDDFS